MMSRGRSLLLEFSSDATPGLVDTYDFAMLGVPKECAEHLAEAFRGVTEHYKIVSRRQAWRSVRKFCAFLAGLENPSSAIHAADILERFGRYLASGLMEKTAGSHFNLISALYKWLGAYGASPVRWLNVRLVRQRFRREELRVRSNELNESTLRKIAAACKGEIVISRRQILLGRDIKSAQAELGHTQAALLAEMISLGRQGIHTKEELRRRGVKLRGKRIRALQRYKEPTTRTLLPYLLLILIGTAANPWSIMNLESGCLEQHPTDPLMARFYWTKGRASREQFSDVLRAGTYALPTLLSDLERGTMALRCVAIERYARHVFIARVNKSSRTPSIQGWHNALTEFRAAHRLPYFTFTDIRRGIAAAITSRGEGIEAVRRTLQHNSVRTTERYLDSPGVLGKVKARTLDYQGQIVAAAERAHRAARYETAYGFICADPVKGTAIGSRKGEPCLEFAQCATCENAIFVIDDATYVARIIVARDAIEAFRERCARGAAPMERFNYAFAPTLAVADAILKKVKAPVLSRARKIARSLPAFPVE